MLSKDADLIARSRVLQAQRFWFFVLRETSDRLQHPFPQEREHLFMGLPLPALHSQPQCLFNTLSLPGKKLTLSKEDASEPNVDF